MQRSHSSSQKLIDWLVRCHGYEWEADRWWEGYSYHSYGKYEYYLYVCVGGWGTYTARQIWPGSGQWSVVVGTGVSRQRVKDWYRHLDPSTRILPDHHQHHVSILAAARPWLECISLHLEHKLHSNLPSCNPHITAALLTSYLPAMLTAWLWRFHQFICLADTEGYTQLTLSCWRRFLCNGMGHMGHIWHDDAARGKKGEKSICFWCICY